MHYSGAGSLLVVKVVTGLTEISADKHTFCTHLTGLMAADTRSCNTTERLLPVNRPKQTPDGFSVPGWGGLVAPPGAGTEEAGGSGSR